MVSLLFLAACSASNEVQQNEKRLSNEDKASTGVEIQPNLTADSEPLSDDDSKMLLSANDDENTNTQTEHQLIETEQVIENQNKDIHNKSASEKSHYLLNNEPTKQVIKSIESVTDTLNMITFGIFATDHW
ncbi:hypothetical protein VIOR3934_05264 [Vibrio orientalis CIP 102891 = ATCC 33934]|uniref:Uncharacterized protein n=1 Tax=Vibrio orientalis CIP 102891 = ATCC 33934 TaxID=675816 RepID=C9QFA0_VIBOR|nr:hypothetical protein VIA_002030 [Vibrio orientalis CIP 102891 = ATCC 33934]EGU53000.1 hypothetical protein VIOR3934_05264 [Vibrio orientalis CIP 102891 = ATCC 33934]